MWDSGQFRAHYRIQSAYKERSVRRNERLCGEQLGLFQDEFDRLSFVIGWVVVTGEHTRTFHTVRQARVANRKQN